MNIRPRRSLTHEVLETRLPLTDTTFVPHEVLSTLGVDELRAAAAADLDGDGDFDVLASFRNTIIWLENTDGLGTLTYSDSHGEMLDPSTDDFFASEKIYFLEGVDIDGDHDLDIVSADRIEKQLLWFENIDGKGTFSDARRIAYNAALPELSLGTLITDFDGDDDIDVLSVYLTWDSENRIVWYANDGMGNFAPPATIATLPPSRLSQIGQDPLAVYDIDNDGDKDVLYAEPFTSKLILALNNGDFTFAVTSTEIDAVTLVRGVATTADLIIGSHDKLSLYQLPGDGTLKLLHSTPVPNTVVDIELGNPDGDADQDFIFRTDERTLYWVENMSNAMSSPRDILAAADYIFRGMVSLSDLDADGDDDLFLGESDTFSFSWFESQPSRVIGDVNNDQRFDSADLVRVFQAGQYEDDADGNSTYNTGDWNSDGDFDSRDLVYVFQQGTYQATAIAASLIYDTPFTRFSQAKTHRLRKVGTTLRIGQN